MSAIEQALEMHEKWNGKIETTANTLKLSKASVTSYLPYQKGVYFPSTASYTLSRFLTLQTVPSI